MIFALGVVSPVPVGDSEAASAAETGGRDR
jgi:hypothetical protein